LDNKGITLVAQNYLQICANLEATAPVRGLDPVLDDELFKNIRQVMVDVSKNASFKARFQPISEANRANVTIAIEMKRLWAPNFIFVVPLSENSSNA
jgi:hypothetical protein